MLMDDRGNALDAYDSLREGIKGLRAVCEGDPEARNEVALLVYDGDGKPIDVLTWADIDVTEGAL
jgi:hypothetical protein